MFIETRELPVTAPARVGRYHALAEAIRCGSRRTKPLKGNYFMDRGNEFAESACALGAAALGAGYSNGSVWDYLYSAFRNIWHDKIGGVYLPDKIAALNNSGVRREDIADWLETL